MASLHIPAVTIDDLRSFHAKHFSHTPTPASFLYGIESQAQVQEAEEYYEEGDDGLGYYDDGVKRTLTDEQIAMFRHSEIQRILQERRRRREVGEVSTPEIDTTPAGESLAQLSPVEQPQIVTSSAPTPTSQTSPSTPSDIDKVQTGRVEKPQQNWVKAGPKTKARNAKNRKKNRQNHRKRKKEERKKKDQIWKNDDQDENGEEGEESDEWDPWHQATGPDAQKDTTVDLDY